MLKLSELNVTFDSIRGQTLRLLAAPFLLSVVGCTPFNYQKADAPTPLASVNAIDKSPRIAVVLGSGGPRGFAHIGILRVLEEEGIYPDLIVGSSVGAFIGSFWASGMSAVQIDELSKTGGPFTVFDPSLFADRGWVKGDRLQNYIQDNLETKKIEDLPRKLIVVATRRNDKQPIYFNQGNIGVAVRASSAMPGIISPVGIQNIEYEDGDESLPVPVTPARESGSMFVIAIDVSARPGTTPDNAPNSFKVRDQLRRQRIDPEIAKADFVIHPDLGYWAGPYSSYFENSRVIGEQYARKIMPQLKQAIASQFKSAGQSSISSVNSTQ